MTTDYIELEKGDALGVGKRLVRIIPTWSCGGIVTFELQFETGQSVFIEAVEAGQGSAALEIGYDNPSQVEAVGYVYPHAFCSNCPYCNVVNDIDVDSIKLQADETYYKNVCSSCGRKYNLSYDDIEKLQNV